MVDIPPEIQIKTTIQPGSVFYFPEETFTSDDPHYFIVINKNPLTDDVLLLVCSSSKIDSVKSRTRHWPGTSILIRQPEYVGFTVDSIVDCNRVFSRKIDHLVQKLSEGRLEVKPRMDIAIVEKLR